MHDGQLEGWQAGDPAKTHGERLPGDVLTLLGQYGRTVDDVDLFAVCAGPGSFTGLRVGLATVQGLALAHGRSVLGVSTLEVLAYFGLWGRADDDSPPSRIIPWMNAHRGEVFAAVYALDRGGDLVLRHPPCVGTTEGLLSDWLDEISGARALFVGDAVEPSMADRVTGAAVVPGMHPLAPALARVADTRGLGMALSPGALRPVYVRRPDAELARERRVSLKRR